MPEQANVSDWTKVYLEDDLKAIDKEVLVAKRQLDVDQLRIATIQGVSERLNAISTGLLTEDGELEESCIETLAVLGWQTSKSDSLENIIELRSDTTVAGIMLMNPLNKHVDRQHLAELTIAQATYWSKLGYEPKAFLAYSKAQDRTLAQNLVDYAINRSFSLITYEQLLVLYGEILIRSVSADELRGKLMKASGFVIEPVVNIDARGSS